MTQLDIALLVTKVDIALLDDSGVDISLIVTKVDIVLLVDTV